MQPKNLAIVTFNRPLLNCLNRRVLNSPRVCSFPARLTSATAKMRQQICNGSFFFLLLVFWDEGQVSVCLIIPGVKIEVTRQVAYLIPA